MEKREEHAVEAEEDHDAISLLPGFRFHPTDEELVGFYLRRKVENVPPCLEIIKEIDIYQHDPWDLPMITAGTKELFFFCLRGRKYRNSIRPNRVTRSGFWKATGIDRPIHSPADSGACIGLKKSLVYYTGFAGKGTKTEWVMHELRLPSAENNTAATVPEAEVWTICRIFKRSLVNKKQLHRFQLSSTHRKQKTAPWSSSVATSCFESANKDNEYSCSTTSSSCYPNGANGGGELRFIADYLFAQDQNGQVLHGGQIWDSIGQAPRMEPAPSVAQSPCVDELFITSEWDELRRIEQFMADDSLSPLQ